MFWTSPCPPVRPCRPCTSLRHDVEVTGSLENFACHGWKIPPLLQAWIGLEFKWESWCVHCNVPNIGAVSFLREIQSSPVREMIQRNQKLFGKTNKQNKHFYCHLNVGIVMTNSGFHTQRSVELSNVKVKFPMFSWIREETYSLNSWRPYFCG